MPPLDEGVEEPPGSGLLGPIHEQLRRIEAHLAPGVREAEAVEARLAPAWRRTTDGEHRLPVAAAVGVAIVLQVVLPNKLVIHPIWLLPVLEGLLIVGLVAANPGRINRTSTLLRAGSLALIVLISIANGWSTGQLIYSLVSGVSGNDAALLLASGASVYITNIIAFALWYWEWDRGGPVARAQGTRTYPDFLFPQMVSEGVAPADWEPNFLDYLYVSFTNATAFSPTDTMPLSRWAKMLMLAQSSIALLTVAFVIARAINVLR